MTIHLECADELLSTTRAVRKRLDFTRPVPRQVILDCIRLSQQAPTASNSQAWRWLVVTDAEKRRALADLYRDASEGGFHGRLQKAAEEGHAQNVRMYDAVQYLADNMEKVPVLVIPCLAGKPPTHNLGLYRGYWASIYPAIWSFNLALRARGLGTVLATLLVKREAEVAKLLGIPEDVVQAALLPVAYTIGDAFHPAERPAPESITYWDEWGRS